MPERGVRLHLEMPPGSTLSGLARPVFEQGSAGGGRHRWDSLDALLRQEVADRR